MRFIAHRGLVNELNKENTINAFKAAIDSKLYAGFELDIRVTKDNVIVVYHDLMYHGKLVRNCLYKEMQKDNIPKLIDVLKLDTNKLILIEIKDHDINLNILSKILNKFKNKNIYITSFNTKVLKDIKKINYNFKIGPLNYVLNSEDDYEIYNFICLINYFLTENLIDYFLNKNILLFAYGIKDKKSINNNKINYIIDDYILTKLM